MKLWSDFVCPCCEQEMVSLKQRFWATHEKPVICPRCQGALVPEPGAFDMLCLCFLVAAFFALSALNLFPHVYLLLAFVVVFPGAFFLYRARAPLYKLSSSQDGKEEKKIHRALSVLMPLFVLAALYFASRFWR